MNLLATTGIPRPVLGSLESTPQTPSPSTLPSPAPEALPNAELVRRLSERVETIARGRARQRATRRLPLCCITKPPAIRHADNSCECPWCSQGFLTGREYLQH